MTKFLDDEVAMRERFTMQVQPLHFKSFSKIVTYCRDNFYEYSLHPSKSKFKYELSDYLRAKIDQALGSHTQTRAGANAYDPPTMPLNSHSSTS